MATNIRIKLRDTSNKSVREANNQLEKLGIADRCSFLSDRTRKKWLHEINTQPDHPLANLRKELGGEVTEENLIDIFPDDSELGLVELDIAFDRIPSDELAVWLQFVADNLEKIAYVRHLDTLIQKSGLEDTYSQLLDFIPDGIEPDDDDPSPKASKPVMPSM